MRLSVLPKHPSASKRHLNLELLERRDFLTAEVGPLLSEIDAVRNASTGGVIVTGAAWASTMSVSASVSFPTSVLQRETVSFRIDSLSGPQASEVNTIQIDWGDGRVDSSKVGGQAFPITFLKTYYIDPAEVAVKVSARLSNGSLVPLSTRIVSVLGSSPDVSDRLDEGLLAEVFRDTTFSGVPTRSRIDPTVFFDFGLNRADSSLPEGDQDFSIRWTGTYTPQFDGPHKFFVQTGSSDSARLFINGTQLINSFGSPNAEERSAWINLTAEKPVDFRLEFVGGAGNSLVRLLHETNGSFKTSLASERLRPSKLPSDVRQGALLERFSINTNNTNPPTASIAMLRSSRSFTTNVPESSHDLASFQLIPGELISSPKGYRIRSLLTPTSTGTYTFALTASDAAELWISSNTSPAQGQKVAEITTATSHAGFTRLGAAKSSPIYLVAGNSYYIESLLVHDVLTRSPHMAVGWSQTDVPRSISRLIPSTHLRPILPTVKLFSDVSSTTETMAGSKPAVTRVVRNDDLGRDLVVHYSAGGNATPGTDYQPLHGSVTIPAGRRDVEILTTTIADDLVELSETVVLRLEASNRYQLDSESTRQVTNSIAGNLPTGTQLLPDPALTLSEFSDYVPRDSVTFEQVCLSEGALPMVLGACPGSRQGLRVNVNEFDVPWDVAVTHTFPASKISQGDKLAAHVWARSANADGTTAKFGMRLQERSSYFGQEQVWEIGIDWTLIEWSFVANFDGDILSERSLDLRLGYKQQVVEFADFGLRKFPAESDLPSILQRSATYDGRSANDSWRRTAELSAMMKRSQPIEISVQDAVGSSVPGANVTVTPLSPILPIGMAISPFRIIESPDPTSQSEASRRYRSIVENFFNILTDGGEAQWGPWLEDRSLPTAFLQWVVERGFDYHGHSLVWGKMDGFPAPENLLANYRAQPATSAKAWLRRQVLDHVTNGPAAAFAGTRPDSSIPKVTWWDAINHPVLSRDIWDILGNGFMLQVLEAAKATVHPDTLLLINEDHILDDPDGAANDAFFELLEWLDETSTGGNAAYDQIGFQSHFESDRLPSIEKILAELEQYEKFGRRFQVTEFDVDSVYIDEQTQADFTRDFYLALAANENVEILKHWGFWQGDHWRSDERAGLFELDWTPKANGQVLLDQLSLDRNTTQFTSNRQAQKLSVQSDRVLVRVEYQGHVIEKTLKLDEQSTFVLAFEDLVVREIIGRNGVPMQDSSFGLPGEAFLMFSATNVKSRFASIDSNASESLIAVRRVGNTWVYDNDVTYVPFTPRATDRLIGHVDLKDRRLTMFKGLNTTYETIALGYASTDIVVRPNVWGGLRNFGEFGISGSQISFPIEPPSGVWVGKLNSGIVSSEIGNARVGEGYLMHSRTDLRSRMPTVPIATATHLVMVRWMDGQWFYDNNSSYVPFIPRNDDRLIAKVDLKTRKVTMLQGLTATYQDIAAGYLRSDLVVTPNIFGTKPNFGEFGLQGSYIQFE